MSQPRYAAQRDANEPEIIEALKAVGASVLQLNSPKVEGVPDLCAGHSRPIVCPKCAHAFALRQNTLIEVKARGGKLSPPQDDFFATWNGSCWVAHSPAEGLAAIGAIPPPPVGMDCMERKR